MKKENNKYKSPIRLLLSVFIIAFTSLYIGNKQDLYHRGEGATTKAFYSIEKDSLDYVVIGSSSAMLGVSPLEIYKDTNLKGYNLSMSGVISDVYCSMLNEVLERQKNAVIVVDVDGFLQYDGQYEDKSPALLWIRSMNINDNFLQTVKVFDKENIVEYLFPVLKYHKNLTSDGYFKEIINISDYNFYTESKGFNNSPDGVYRFDEYNPDRIIVWSVETDEAVELQEKSNYYLHCFLNICKENDLKNVLFVRFPKSGMTESDYNKKVEKTEYSNYIRQEIEPYGYKLIDYLTLDNPAGIEASEFIDRAHLHVDGAIKFSRFLEKYLVDIMGDNHSPDEDWDSLSNNIDEIYNKIRY